MNILRMFLIFSRRLYSALEPYPPDNASTPIGSAAPIGRGIIAELLAGLQGKFWAPGILQPPENKIHLLKPGTANLPIGVMEGKRQSGDCRSRAKAREPYAACSARGC